MKIFINYSTTDQPWGGINSFIRGFHKFLLTKKHNGVEVVDKFQKDIDIFFMAASSEGQGKYIEYDKIKKMKNRRENLLFNLLKKQEFKIVHRLDGLRTYYNDQYDPGDDEQFKLSTLADHIIFQSKYSLKNFSDYGYQGNDYDIIFNGVDQGVYNLTGRKKYDKPGKLKILSASWSHNINKGFEAIAAFSENENVDSVFVGNWNPETNKKNVKTIEPVGQLEMAKLYKEADVFLHAASNDPCPNVVLEAMSSGLPVIYNQTGGTPEIASDYGVKLLDDLSPDSIDTMISDMKDNYNELFENLKTDHAKFSIKTAGQKYLDTFKSITNKSQ